jgi:hypothetical protein
MSWQRALAPDSHLRRGHRFPWATFTAMATSCFACISTDLDSIQLLPACNSTDGEGGGSASVVQIITHQKAADMPCSGVAISPILMLTTLGCVAEANDPLQSDPVELIEPIAGPGNDVEHATVADYSAICDVDEDWALRERGNFEGRPGELVPPPSIEVYRLPLGSDPFDPDAYQIVKASNVFTSRSSSRCRDDIAVLQLEEPLAVEPVNLWLGGDVPVGERVTLTNFCSDAAGLSAVGETPSQVLALTRDAAQPMLPPRSLLLTGQVSSDAPGGAVFLADSHSLVGTIVSGTKNSCDTQTSEGSTIATALSSYQGLLFDAASAAREVLRLAPNAPAAYLQNLSDCSMR